MERKTRKKEKVKERVEISQDEREKIREEERSKILKELRKEKHVEANLDWEIRVEQQLKSISSTPPLISKAIRFRHLGFMGLVP